MNEDIVGLIPAAGIGKRLYPFSRAVPKEMYPILGKAVIEHSIENLKVGGIDRIYMIVGFQKGSLMDYIGDGSFFGVNVVYIYQLKRRGLGHGVLQGRGWIDKTFVTLLGDSFIEPKEELRELIDYHRKEKPLATLMLFEVKDTEGYGIVKFKNLRDGTGPVERMIEKPSIKEAENLKTDGKFYAICGAYVFEPEIFKYLEKTKPGLNEEVQLTDAMMLALKNGEKINGFVLKGKYIDIGKWKTVLRTEKELLNGMDIDSHIKEREGIMEKVMEHEENER
jgi:UTP-glucose-1-phosphate uridylyltransferase